MLTTKHAKSVSIAPPFWDKLGATIIEYVTDTDQFGAFSGEVERTGSALECARKKCEHSFKLLGESVEFALASEGSFGPHPLIPILPCGHEILYFIDRRHGFHLHISRLFERTNYLTRAVCTLDELQQLCSEVDFPSHALILRPHSRESRWPIFKGVCTQSDLEQAYRECQRISEDKGVWVETDMRAHYNPTRMRAIGELAGEMATRLTCHCANCGTPGWGRIRVEKGLECSGCGMKTELVKSEVFGCAKCSYELVRPRSDGVSYAEPRNCGYCNP